MDFFYYDEALITQSTPPIRAVRITDDKRNKLSSKNAEMFLLTKVHLHSIFRMNNCQIGAQSESKGYARGLGLAFIFIFVE